MRVATWNIHGWKTADNKPNLIAVGDTLAAIQPDIIGLNEVFYPRIAEGSSKPALEALAERLGMNFIFGPCLRWQVQDDMPADAYGNAILSRWPIIASSAHITLGSDLRPEKFSADGYHPSAASYAELGDHVAAALVPLLATTARPDSAD